MQSKEVNRNDTKTSMCVSVKERENQQNIMIIYKYFIYTPKLCRYNNKKENRNKRLLSDMYKAKRSVKTWAGL